MTDSKGKTLLEKYIEQPALKEVLATFAQTFMDDLATVYYFWKRASVVTGSKNEQEIMERGAGQFKLALEYVTFLHQILGLPDDITLTDTKLEADFQKVLEEAKNLEHAEANMPKEFLN